MDSQTEKVKPYSPVTFTEKSKTLENKNFTIYKIQVATGDQLDAGSTNLVEIAFMEKDIISDYFVLRKSNMPINFARGSIEKFFIKAPIFNNLEYIVVNMINASEDEHWFLKEMQIQDQNSGKCWYTTSSYWFSSQKEDAKTSRIIKMKFCINNETKFWVIMNAVSQLFKEPLYIKCFGSLKNSAKIPLKNSLMNEEKNIYRYSIKLSDVGIINTVRIGIIKNESWKPSNKILCRVLIKHLIIKPYKTNLPIFATFNDKWLTKTNIENDYIDFYGIFGDYNCPSTKMSNTMLDLTEPVDYHISIWQSLTFLENFSDVYIQMLGKNGKWSEIFRIPYVISNDNFEKFQVTAQNTGPIMKINVWRNKPGSVSAWHLEKIKIVRYFTQQEIMITLHVLKRQGKLPPELKISDTKMLLNLEHTLPFESKCLPQIKNDYSITLINVEKGKSVCKESGDISTCDATQTYEILTSKQKRPQNFNLPYAEECMFVCQNWIALDEGGKTIEKILPLHEKKILYTSIKLMASKL